MSYFTQYTLKDGRKIRGKYDSKSTKVCISRSDLEELIYEVDVAYEQARQLQTIIENLQEIKKQATTRVLDKIKTETEQIEINGRIKDVECFRAGINTVLNIINKYKKSEE